jgi:hypothetical protein
MPRSGNFLLGQGAAFERPTIAFALDPMQQLTGQLAFKKKREDLCSRCQAFTLILCNDYVLPLFKQCKAIPSRVRKRKFSEQWHSSSFRTVPKKMASLL